MTRNHSNLQPFCWLPTSSLPDALKRYVDPEQPLRDGDVFHTSASFSLLYLYFGYFWLLCFVSLFIAMSIELVKAVLAAASDAPSPLADPPLMFLLGLLAVSIFGAYKSWQSISERHDLRRRWRQGRYREGLFVLDDGLLLHQADQVHYLPKQAITGFQDVSRGKSERRDFQILYNSAKQERCRKSLHHLDLDISSFDLKVRLDAWLHNREE